MKANLSLQVIPIKQENPYPVIDQALQIIKDSKIKHIVGPFSTSLEGELPVLMALIDQIKDTCLQACTGELILNIQIHLKKDQDVTFEQKIGAWA